MSLIITTFSNKKVLVSMCAAAIRTSVFGFDADTYNYVIGHGWVSKLAGSIMNLKARGDMA